MTFIMTGESSDPEWFTPSLKYLSMKKELLGQFPDEETWGEFGTERQIIALSNLLDFFKKTRNLTDQFPQLLSEVIIDNKNLVIKRALKFPNKLYEQLLLAVVEGAQEEYPSFWDQPSSVTFAIIEEFLARRKAGCLAAYARLQDQDPIRSLVLSKERYEPEQVSDDTCEEAENCSTELSQGNDLRKLRNKIYARIQAGQPVSGCIRQFHFLTEDFITICESELTIKESEKLRRRVTIARYAAKAANSKNKPEAQIIKTVRPIIRKYSDSAVEEVKVVDDNSDSGDYLADKFSNRLEVSSNSSESRIARGSEPLKLTDQDEVILPEVPHDLDPFDFVHKPFEIIEQDIDEQIQQRLTKLKLEPANSAEDVDEQIRQRLTKLKFFSNAWEKSSAGAKPSLSKEIQIKALNIDTEATESSVDEAVPVESTEEDRRAFNDWYYEKLITIITSMVSPGHQCPYPPRPVRLRWTSPRPESALFPMVSS